MAKYKLKEGVILKPYGKDSLIDNNNLTDAIAEHLLNSGKASVEDFEQEVKEQTKEEIKSKHKK